MPSSWKALATMRPYPSYARRTTLDDGANKSSAATGNASNAHDDDTVCVCITTFAPRTYAQGAKTKGNQEEEEEAGQGRARQQAAIDLQCTGTRQKKKMMMIMIMMMMMMMKKT